MVDEDLCLSLERLFWLDPFSSEDVASWAQAVETYVKETEVNHLELYGCEIGSEHWDGNRLLEYLMKFLPDSKVVDLSLFDYNLCGGGMRNFSPLNKIKETRIEKLDIKYSKLSYDDLLALVAILRGKEVVDFDVKGAHSQIVYISHAFSFVYRKYNSSFRLLSHSNNNYSLKTLDLTHIFCLDEKKPLILVEESPNSSITQVSLVDVFPMLKFTETTSLNLQANQITTSMLKVLCENLKDSKLEILDLGHNDINDAGINILAEGLVGSKVIELNLERNKFAGLNDLGRYLVRTNIKNLKLGLNKTIKNEKLFSFPDFFMNSSIVMLDIGGCHLGDQLGQKLMKSLKYSSVRTLIVSHNKLGHLSISEFSNNIKDINVMDINLSYNQFSSELFVILGDCLKESRIQCIDVSGCCKPKSFTGLFYLIEKTKSCSVLSFTISHNELSGSSSELWSKVLVDTKFTYLTASYNDFSKCAVSLADHLKFSTITSLGLSDVKLGDKGMEAIVKSLNGSIICELDISCNQITSHGAQVLANVLKESNLLYVNLSSNLIENDGLEALAKRAEGTLITSLDVFDNPGDRMLIIDAALWKNRTVLRKLVATFKQIAPEADDQTFHFHRLAEGNFSEIFYECLLFHKKIVELPSAISAFTLDKTLSFSRDQLLSLFSDFPTQFALFIRMRVETGVSDLVSFLVKANELGSSSVVESLLLHRPLFMIDEDLGILHPHVYILLHEYKLPICNLDVEPEGKAKIQKYFVDHADLPGAEDVIKLLQNESIV